MSTTYARTALVTVTSTDYGACTKVKGRKLSRFSRLLVQVLGIKMHVKQDAHIAELFVYLFLAESRYVWAVNAAQFIQAVIQFGLQTE